jgi:hypothetical protein
MEGGTCLRCGAPYEAEATVCYSCGAPIGETRSNTQPVPAIRRIRPDEAEAGSSLPVGQVAAASLSVAPVPLSRPLVALGRRRKRPLWPVLLLACVLVLGAFGGAAYVLRLVTASPNVSQQTLYRDPGRRFSFQRPTLWQVSATGNGVSLSDGTGTSTAVLAVRAANGGESAASAADAIGAPLKLASEPARVIGGASWEQRAGQATGPDGAVRQYVALATLRGGEIYTIEFSSPVASYAATDTLVYQPLLDSFVFGDAG